ncbi:hypothetical protein ACFOEE_08455 [Pseudoalteromonas fenneropenaei]|uniref:Uncharacterized protein n=1 Tax=Pseudoalteromonas fenneropenaei TaxID=1737459 RepID=A0ABV7CIU9_9GAMM
MKKTLLLSFALVSGVANAQLVTCTDYIKSIDMQSDGNVWIYPERHETIELEPTHKDFYEYLGIMYYAMQNNKKVVYTSDNGEGSNKCHDATESLFPLYEIIRVTN